MQLIHLLAALFVLGVSVLASSGAHQNGIPCSQRLLPKEASARQLSAKVFVYIHGSDGHRVLLNPSLSMHLRNLQHMPFPLQTPAKPRDTSTCRM